MENKYLDTFKFRLYVLFLFVVLIGTVLMSIKESRQSHFNRQQIVYEKLKQVGELLKVPLRIRSTNHIHQTSSLAFDNSFSHLLILHSDGETLYSKGKRSPECISQVFEITDNGDNLGRIEYCYDFGSVESKLLMWPLFGLFVLVAFMFIFIYLNFKSQTNAFLHYFKKIESIDPENPKFDHTKEDINDPNFQGLYQKTHDLMANLRNAMLVKNRYEVEKERLSLARQVAHDIRSPLAALKTLNEMNLISDESSKKMYEMSLERMNTIAEDLLTKTKSSKQVISCNIKVLVEELIEEKKIFIPENVKVHCELNEMNALLIPSDFKRIISNIINNCIESFETNGFIEIKSHISELKSTLIISDNGRGIPEDVLKELGTKELTHGKTDGNGLGIYHAANTLRSWGGDLSIHSLLGKGTIVTLEFLTEEENRV
jgi:signal transduction histidine kinase